MSRHRADRPEESATLLTTGSGGSPPASVPVQVTNVVQIIAEHVPAEYSALLVYINRLEDQRAAAVRYKEQLEKIAADAGVTLTVPQEGQTHG